MGIFEALRQNQERVTKPSKLTSKYAKARALMRKFPGTWVSLSQMKNKHSAQSYASQLKHGSSPSLPAADYGFRIHEMNDEWWVQAQYLEEEDD